MSLPVVDDQNKITDEEQRISLLVYLLIVLLSSLIGDTLILLSSTRRNAFKLNRFLVSVMQHIAVGDIVESMSLVLPTLVSVTANRWIFGDFSRVFNFVSSVSSMSNSVLMCLLTTSKLIMLKFPRPSRNWSKKHAHCICILVWLTALVVAVIITFFLSTRPVFLYIYYIASLDLLSKTSSDFDTARVFLFTIMPTFIVMMTTVFILHHLCVSRRKSRRSGGSLRWQGVVTVVATALVFFVAHIPATVIYFCFLSDMARMNKLAINHYEMYLCISRISYYMTYLNIMSNFYIYSLTVPSFRIFLKVKANLMARKLRNIFSATDNGVYDENTNHVTLAANDVTLETIRL